MNTKRAERSRKSLTVRVAASALVLSASLTGVNAMADHKGYQQKQDNYRYASIHSNHRDVVRVNIPIRDHGPEYLPLGRLVRAHSNIDPDRYWLKAVVTDNGRYSNGYATLRTGNRKTGRYFLGSSKQTRILAPNRADNAWRLRLGPGTQVKSVTVVLAPRAQHLAHRSDYNNSGWSHTRKPAGSSRHSVSVNKSHGSWMGVAWLLAKAEQDKREKKQNRQLKKTRAELARTEAELDRTQEKLAQVKARNKQPKKQAPQRDAGQRKSRDTDDQQNRRYVISGGKDSRRSKHS